MTVAVRPMVRRALCRQCQVGVVVGARCVLCGGVILHECPEMACLLCTRVYVDHHIERARKARLRSEVEESQLALATPPPAVKVRELRILPRETFERPPLLFPQRSRRR